MPTYCIIYILYMYSKGVFGVLDRVRTLGYPGNLPAGIPCRRVNVTYIAAPQYHTRSIIMYRTYYDLFGNILGYCNIAPNILPYPGLPGFLPGYKGVELPLGTFYLPGIGVLAPNTIPVSILRNNFILDTIPGWSGSCSIDPNTIPVKLLTLLLILIKK